VEFRYGWPVIADGAGVVLVKLRLPWSTLWVDWPQTNAAIRQFLTQNPQHQALYVLRLSDGVSPYIANIGHGGYGDGDYLPMGPQPVVKRFPNGKEVVYTVVRAKACVRPALGLALRRDDARRHDRTRAAGRRHPLHRL
jgi:hypothetical protein